MPDERDAPATKADLQGLAIALKSDIKDLRTESKGDMHAMEERVVERIRDSQTEVLRAFHGWARSMEIRSRGTTATVVGLDERLVLVEERVSELERRIIG